MNKLSRGLLSATFKVALVTMLFAGCSKNIATSTDTLYTPTVADVTSTATLADLQAGRSVYINSCGRCHGLYSPDSYSASSWKTIVPGMASKAGLSATETTQVTKYVTRGK